MKHSVLVRVEFDSIDQATDNPQATAECLLNILDLKCAENVGVKGGIQFHRIENAPVSDMDLIDALEVKQREAVASMDANYTSRKRAFVRHLDAVIYEIRVQEARRQDYGKTVKGAEID